MEKRSSKPLVDTMSQSSFRASTHAFFFAMMFPKFTQVVAWLLLLAMPGEFLAMPFRPATLPILLQFSNATYGMSDSTRKYPSSQPEQRQRQARKQDPVKYVHACRKVCAEFLVSAKKGATCDCPRGTKMVVGKIPFVCQPVQNCPRSVCVEYTLQGVLQVQETAGNGEHEEHVTISLQSMEMWAFYRHAAYQGEGTFGNGKTCRQWFLLDDLVYECASCTVCPNGHGIDLDCSNIQPKAVLNQCDNDDESSSLDLFSVFDYCPEGGAPKPLTPGTESVTGMKKTRSQATTTWCGDTTKKATWCWTTCLLISTCLYMVHF